MIENPPAHSVKAREQADAEGENKMTSQIPTKASTRAKLHQVRIIISKRLAAGYLRNIVGDQGRDLLTRAYGDIAKRHPARFEYHVLRIVNALHSKEDGG